MRAKVNTNYTGHYNYLLLWRALQKAVVEKVPYSNIYFAPLQSTSHLLNSMGFVHKKKSSGSICKYLILIQICPVIMLLILIFLWQGFSTYRCNDFFFGKITTNFPKKIIRAVKNIKKNTMLNFFFEKK